MATQPTFRERFPGPWAIEEMPGGFRVIAGDGTPLTYVYAPTDQQRSAIPGRTLTHAEAKAIATAITGLVQSR